MYSNHWFQFFLVFLYDHCIELSLGLPSFVLVPLTSSAFFRNFPVYIFLSPFFFTLRGMFRPFSAERRGGGLEVLGGRTMARKPRPGGGPKRRNRWPAPQSEPRRRGERTYVRSACRNGGIFFFRGRHGPHRQGGDRTKSGPKKKREINFFTEHKPQHTTKQPKKRSFFYPARELCVCVCV